MGIFRLPQKIIKFGRGLDEKLKLIFDNGEANPPFISYDENEKTLKFSNDGSTEIPIGSGSGSGSGVNFILNSDFEVNDANVTVSNMTKEISESPHLVGKKSLKLVSQVVDGSADILADVIDVWFVGKAVRAIASIKVDVGDFGDFTVGVYNVTDDTYVTDLNGATTTDLANGDTLFSTEFIPAANKVYAIRVETTSSEASNIVYVDQAFLGEIVQKDFEVINKDHSDTFSLASNKHYIINMHGAGATKALTMPAGLSKSQIRISVKYDPTTTTKQEVQLTAAGSDKFMYGGVQDTIVTLGEISDWALFSWDDNGNWVVDDPSNFTSRTLVGDWTIDGSVNVDVTKFTDSDATKLGMKKYLHGTTYNGGNAPTIGGSGITPVSGVFIPYQCKDGSWRMKFTVSITFSGTTSAAFTVNGILTNSSIQPVYGHASTANWVIGYFASSGNTCPLQFGATMTGAYISGDIGLSSKPTWAY